MKQPLVSFLELVEEDNLLPFLSEPSGENAPGRYIRSGPVGRR